MQERDCTGEGSRPGGMESNAGIQCRNAIAPEHPSELLCAFRRSAPEPLTIQELTGHHVMVDPPSIH